MLVHDRYNIISLICLPLYTTCSSQPLNVEIYESLTNVYCVKLVEWKQAGNKNINRENILQQYKYVRNKTKSEEIIKSAFEAAWIWSRISDSVVKPTVAEEVIFKSPV